LVKPLSSLTTFSTATANASDGGVYPPLSTRVAACGYRRYWTYSTWVKWKAEEGSPINITPEDWKPLHLGEREYMAGKCYAAKPLLDEIC
jgi:hypothetical protein